MSTSLNPAEGIAVLSVGLGVGAAIMQIFGGMTKSRTERSEPENKSPVTKEFCGVKHDELDHRIGRLETSVSEGFARMDRTLERVFDRVDTMNDIPSKGRTKL